MEIIFDSIEERDEFFEATGHCPSQFGGKNNCLQPCKECWKQSGVKYSVKTAYYHDAIPQRITRVKELYAALVHDDPEFRPDDYDWIVGEGIIDHIAESGLEYRSVGQKYRALMDICVTVDYDYPLRVSLCKKMKKEPKQVYTTTASRPDDLLMDRLMRNMLNAAYGKDGIKPFVVPARQCGKTEMYRQVMDELRKTKGDRHSDNDKLDALSYSYRHTDWKEAIEVFMDKHDRIKKPQIEKVIFNDPATIVFWKDGTKTVVKVRENDAFDPEKGLAMAICKKIYGEGYWTGVFKEWLPKEKESVYPYCFLDEMHTLLDRPSVHDITVKFMRDMLDEDVNRRMAAFFGQKIFDPELAVKIKHSATEPSEPLRPCEECKHADVHEFQEPCRSCTGNSAFEEKEPDIKTCNTCRYLGRPAYVDPCASCINRSKWEGR